MLNISVLVSGGGTNLQAIIDGIEQGKILGARICQVISNNSEAYALKRAEAHGIRGSVIDKQTYPEMQSRTDALLKALEEENTDLIVLAGYMNVIPGQVVSAYPKKIINIHPSLIPKYSGMGFYGKHVHQAVLDAGESISGATVHFVDEGVDTGPIIVQEQVPVHKEDTAETLAARVLEVEHKILLEAVNQLIKQMAAVKETSGGN